MKKNFIPHEDDVIDLTKLFEIIWDGKIKIFVLVVISILFGIYSYNNNQIPDSFVASIIIKPKNNSEFAKVNYMLDFINQNRKNFIEANENTILYETNIIFLEKFIEELLDYEELVLILKDNKKIKEQISKLSEKQQNRKLFQYSNLLKAEKINLKKTNYNNKGYAITFEWNKSKEAIDILEKIVNLTLKNTENFFYKELLLMLEIKKKKSLDQDNQRLEYLIEQSLIAKELDIVENQIDTINLSKSNVLFSINTNDVAYYLRGSKAIDKEISLIRNREYKQFTNIEKEIDVIMSSKNTWLDYNFNLINVKKIQNSQMSLLKYILGGFLVGIIYVVIANKIQPQTSQKKTNKI